MTRRAATHAGRPKSTRGCARRAHDFFEVVAVTHQVWTVADERGLVTIEGDAGRLTVPFWESEPQAARMREPLGVRPTARTLRVSAQEWLADLLPSLAARDWSVGIAWAGPEAVGFDLEPGEATNALLSRWRSAGRARSVGWPAAFTSAGTTCFPFGW
jgi:hypothetical protein